MNEGTDQPIIGQTTIQKIEATIAETTKTAIENYLTPVPITIGATTATSVQTDKMAIETTIVSPEVTTCTEGTVGKTARAVKILTPEVTINHLTNPRSAQKIDSVQKTETFVSTVANPHTESTSTPTRQKTDASDEDLHFI